jgi:lipopolysaccharide export system permease protein
MGSLSRYIGAAALRAFVLVAASLTALFSLLEFVEQLASVGQGHYRVADALVYVLLTAPGRLLQVASVSMLLGSLLALGALARTSELTAMLSLGLSERRIVGTVLRLTVPIVAVLALLTQFVIPPAQRLAQERRTDALASAASRPDASFWAQGDRQYLNVAQFERGTVPVGIDIYAFEPDGSLASILHAERAEVLPDGTWALAEVSRRTVEKSQFRVEHLPRLSWHSFIPPGQLQFLRLPPDSIPPVALYRQIRSLERQHQRATRYERELWTRAGIPLSMVAMVLIAAPMVFGSPRMQGGQRLARGVGLGIVFTLCQQIVGRLGQLLDLSPAATALAPSLVVLALVVALFPRAGRPRRAAPLADGSVDP